MRDPEILRLEDQLERERSARLTRRALQRLTAQSVAASTIDEVMAIVVDGVGDLFGSHVTSIARPADGAVRFVHGRAVSADIRERWTVAAPGTQVPVVRALEPGATWIELADPSELAAWPLLADEVGPAGIAAYLAIPLRNRNGADPVAALGLGFREPTVLDGEDRALLAEVAELTADVIVRVETLQHAREMASELQSSLLPSRLPVLDGIAVRAVYEPCEGLAGVGGDWYDVIELDDGSAAFVVGDVAGHDMRSAAEMGKVRHVLASQLFDHGDPAVALATTDRYFNSVGDEVFATAVVAVVDADRGRMSVACAAHPPPLSVDDDGVTAVAVRPGPPIGSGLGGYEATSVPLVPGGAVIAFTDGVVERPGISIDDGTEALRAALERTGGRTPVELLRGLRRHLGHADRDDDAAVLLFVRSPADDVAARAVEVEPESGE